MTERLVREFIATMLIKVCGIKKIGDWLETEIDELNQHDRYAVGIMKNELTVRHIPCERLKSWFTSLKHVKKTEIKRKTSTSTTHKLMSFFT